MEDGATKQRAVELIRQIQEKSVQLSDLEVILEDYERERRALLREIGNLKASLWELIGDTGMPLSSQNGGPSAHDEVND
jgi:hypothetical protein